MLDFTRDWQRAHQASHAFCARLKELDLLDAGELNFTLDQGQRAVTRGFSTVDRDRLRTLGAELVAELLRSGDLELVHAHFLSLGCLDALAERLRAAM